MSNTDHSYRSLKEINQLVKKLSQSQLFQEIVASGVSGGFLKGMCNEGETQKRAEIEWEEKKCRAEIEWEEKKYRAEVVSGMRCDVCYLQYGPYCTDTGSYNPNTYYGDTCPSREFVHKEYDMFYANYYVCHKNKHMLT